MKTTTQILLTCYAVIILTVLSGCSEDLASSNVYKSTNVDVAPQSDVQVGQTDIPPGDVTPSPSPSPSTDGGNNPPQDPAQSPQPSGSPQDPTDDQDDEDGDGTSGENPGPNTSPSPSPSPGVENEDPGSDSCSIEAPVISLLAEHGKALKVSGNGGTFNVDGDIQVNSNDKKAIFVHGKDVEVKAKKVAVVGDVKVGPLAKLTADSLQKGAAAMEDPLKDLPAPDCSQLPIQSQKRQRIQSAVTLEPGRYLGGIFIKRGGDVTMKPGIYCLIGGGLRVHRGKLSGDGVMIYNTTRVRHHLRAIDFKKGAVVSLSGIKNCASPYHGITIFQDRSRDRKIRLASNQLSITGMIYAPASRVNVRIEKGGSSHPFTQLIARKLRVNMRLGEAERDHEGDHEGQHNDQRCGRHAEAANESDD